MTDSTSPLPIEFQADATVSTPFINLFYGLSGVTPSHIDAFQKQANQQRLIAEFQSLRQGAIKNSSENRSVLHHQARNLTDNVYTLQQKLADAFADDIHAGKILGYTKKQFTDVVQFGIGGSVLGPKALYHGLCSYFSTHQRPLKLKGHFISHLDPLEFNHKFSTLSPDTTLFIIASKSGSSQETLTNINLLKSWWLNAGHSLDKLPLHCISVTTKGSGIDTPDLSSYSFYMNRSIGGRFSSTSVMGGVLLSLCFGPSNFQLLLSGARDIDANSTTEKVTENLSLLSAFISNFYVRECHFNTKAIIPYSYALSKFPDHLQQLICESNGKNTDVTGAPIKHKTSPVIFGDTGTNAQHSFFQLIHQGTDIIPIEFIGFKSAAGTSLESLDASKKLKSNLIAQILALGFGDQSNHFDGGRPSTLLIIPELSPKTLGALLAYYENMTLFQGFLFNINSFDQPGVELGKSINQKILDNFVSTPPIETLKRYLSF